MKKVLRILGISYATYLVIVLLVITPALNLLPAWAIKKYLGREFHSEIIYFNPFTLSLELHKTALPEHDGSPFVELEGATINLSLASLVSGAFVFDEVGIKQLYVHVRELPGGEFNFSDMVPPTEPEAPPAEPAGFPPVTVELFDFSSRQLVFTSEAREKTSSTSLDGLTIKVHGLSTVLEDGKPYQLDATGEKGGKLHWEGVVSIPGAYSQGSLELSDIELNPLWRFIEPWVAFNIPQGTLGIKGLYKVNWADGFDYWVNEGELRVDGLDVRPAEPGDLPDTGITLGSLKLTGLEVNGPDQHVDVESLALQKLAIAGWSEAEKVSLVDLFAVNLPGDSTQQTPASVEEPAPQEPGWTAELAHFDMVESGVRWRTRYTDPPLLDISPITMSANTIKWPLEGETGLKLALAINEQASVSVEGGLDLAQGAGALDYQLEALPLPWFSPNLPTALNAELTDGQLQLKGNVTLADYAPVLVAMDGSIRNFSGKIREAETSITSWETVRWKKLLVDLEKHQVEMASLSIDNYAGRIHIHKDGSINTQNMWKAEVAEQPEQASESPAQNAAPDEPWVIDVPLIRITDSEVDFMDESLPIPFRTVVGDLNGDIKNISSKAGVRTSVDIKGSVDGYAAVALAGTAEPLRSPPAIDLKLTFDGVDMALLSPYSGTYAGYAIERGVLSLDLEYSMENDHLAGANRIVINQMKLGEKVASDKAVDLPLELALALLTDSQGVIDMKIPVSGNVDDPQFSVGSVVMGALMNLLTKAVTSPFTLLASLVDSEEDLQRLNFKSGSAELMESTSAKLDELGAAMTERPELNLIITGRLQLKSDRERLQKNLLQAQLLAAGLPEAELSSKGPAWEDAIRTRYQTLSPGETELTVSAQYLQLAQNIPLPDSELLDLAAARAVAVKAYLVNETGLAADRAAISKPALDAKTNLYSGVELEIDI